MSDGSNSSGARKGRVQAPTIQEKNMSNPHENDLIDVDDVESYQEPNTKQEPNTGIIQEPNTGIAQEPNTEEE